MSGSDWKTFLAQVDLEETEADVLAASEAFLIKECLKSPAAAAGVKFVNLEKNKDFPSEIPVQAFLARAVQTLNAVDAARRQSQDLNSSAASSAMPSANSALGLAAALAPAKHIDVNDLLKDAGLDELSFDLHIDQSVINKLGAETALAKAQGRKPFLYMDLTNKDILPLWLHPEAVGGRPEEEEMALDGSGDISSLARLGQALKGATENKRAFTTLNHWAAAFLRYAPFAVAAKHLSWPQAMAHLNCIFQLVEEERSDAKGPAVALLYDELARKHLEKRVHKTDQSLNILEFLSEPDKGLLAAARQRVASAKAKLAAGKAPPGKGSVERALASSHREDALQAARALQTQQQDRNRDAASMSDSLPWMRGQSSGSGQSSAWKSKRSQKKDAWVQKQQARQADQKHKKRRW